jgi:hypothetical protein
MRSGAPERATACAMVLFVAFQQVGSLRVRCGSPCARHESTYKVEWIFMHELAMQSAKQSKHLLNRYLCTKQLDQPHDGPRHLLLSPRQTQLGVVLGYELTTRWPRQHRACNLQTTPRDLSGQRGAVSNDVWCTIRGKLVHALCIRPQAPFHWSQRLCLPPALASLARLAVRHSFSCSLDRG